MARSDQLQRTCDLVQALRTYPKTVEQLAGPLGVTSRTVRRDLEFLTTCGLDVQSGRADHPEPPHTRVWWVSKDAPCPLCGHK